MKKKLFLEGVLVAMLCGVLRAQSNQATPEKVLPMASNADASFEVATIKPSNLDHPVDALPLGHRINFPDTTVRFLLTFIYDVHDKRLSVRQLG